MGEYDEEEDDDEDEDEEDHPLTNCLLLKQNNLNTCNFSFQCV